MLPLCAHDGIAVLPWSPLGGGKLTRPWGTRTERSSTDRHNKSMYERGGPADRQVVEAVEALANALGVSMATIAMAWVLQKPEVTAPIVGVSRQGHLDDALAALGLTLTEEEVAQLEAPYRPRAINALV